MELLTRKDALSQGLKHYFTGKPCKRGHVETRDLSGRCVVCQRSNQNKRYSKNADANRERSRKYKAENTDKVKAYQKAYREKNAKSRASYAKNYLEENKESLKEKRKEYESANAKKIQEKRRQRHLDAKADPVRHSALKASRRAYWQKQQAEQTPAVMAKRLRSRVYVALREAKTTKQTSTTDLLGCSLSDFRAHLEAQFLPGMSWDNWALDGWHVDHIRPCASFDLTDPEQQRQCFHFTNLQPLWAEDNIRKGASYDQ